LRLFSWAYLAAVQHWSIISEAAYAFLLGIKQSDIPVLINNSMPSGQKIWVRFRACNARGKSNWSDPACIRLP
jgi:hypothetical protein